MPPLNPVTPQPQKQTVSKPIVAAVQKPGSVLSRIQPIGFGAEQGIQVLLYGQSGSGKTTFWSSFPTPILAMVCSGGFNSGELRTIDTADNKGKIDQVQLTKTEEMTEICKHVDATRSYKTLVLDHVSGYADMGLLEVLGWAEMPAQKSYGMAKREQYGQATAICKENLKRMLTLSKFCNIVIIGQERVFGTGEDGVESDVIRPTVGVGVGPSLASWLNPACDYVIQMFKRPRLSKEPLMVNGKESGTFIEKRLKGVEFCARTEVHDVFMTKFRVPKGTILPDCLILGDSITGHAKVAAYDQIMKTIKGGK